MTNLRIAWLLGSFPVVMLSAAFVLSAPGNDHAYAASFFAGGFVFLPIWWALYFIIRAIFKTS